MITVVLKKERERSVQKGHPWIFSGSIARVEGDQEHSDGAPCFIRSMSGTLLGNGYYNSRSSIRVRVWGYDNLILDKSQLEKRIRQAISLRYSLLESKSGDSCRLINSEGDFIPGLIVDKFGKGLCIQIQTAGMDRMRLEIIQLLKDLLKPDFIYERSDTDSAEREGLVPHNQLVSGVIPDNFTISEQGLLFAVDVTSGQKSGFFLDQRENRMLLREYCSGKNVGDCFCYSGGFSLNALQGGAASVISIDSSSAALELVKKNIALNEFDQNRSSVVEADIFKYLRTADESFDTIILDPPKFARHPGEVDQAARGYKDINLQALKKINSGGILFTFSCSGAVDFRLFRQIVYGAAIDAGRSVQILHRLSQPADHPVNISHLEGEYLKGLVLRVL